MLLIKKVFKIIFLVLITSSLSCGGQHPKLDDGIYAEFVTSKGTMIAKLEYKKVPVTVANFISLAEGTNTMVEEKFKDKKYYNGTTFHRVINDFMIQGGDPTASGGGNPGYKFNDEFHPDLKHNKAGILSMANSGPNTNGSQFFITEGPKPQLDYGYSVFGILVSGLDIQDSISNVKTNKRDKPIKSVILKELNIIRKGKDANNFDAPKVFKNHFIEIERASKKEKEKNEAILKANIEKFKKQKGGATKLDSGLQYYISKKGTGEKLPNQAKVLVHYAIYFENGKFLETSKLETAEALNQVDQRRKAAGQYKPETMDYTTSSQIIPGIKEGLQQLALGDKATLFIPYHLAYGESGTRMIPGKSNLIFEIEVLKFL